MSKSNNAPLPFQSSSSSAPRPGAMASAPLLSHARYAIGDRVRHKVFGFRGVIFDVDPVFANTEEWYEANPLRPDRNQPFYHLLADNGEQSYVAYVSQQNLVPDEGREPIDHPAIAAMFERLDDGAYRLDAGRWH
jgi:heat shock protein HspQ